MIVYRINNCRYINDLSGKGAAMYGGRWNSKDVHMVYTAESRALALLEVVVHVGRIPAAGYCLATIEIPDEQIQVLKAAQLPANWYNNPAPDILKTIGDQFIAANKYLALKIPSVLMQEEHNYLLNPEHSAFSKVRIISERSISVDERLFPPTK